MPFDPWSGEYYTEKTVPTQPDFNQFGQNGGQNSQNNYIYDQANAGGMGSIGDGSVTGGPVPGQQSGRSPNSPTAPGYGGPPPVGVSNPYPSIFQSIGDGTVTGGPVPGQQSGRPPNDMSRPGYGGPLPGQQPATGYPFPTAGQPSANLPAPVTGGQNQPAQPGVTPTGNSGTDRANPPGPGYFWSGTANHWVDPTYQHDATGRQLTQEEMAWNQLYDRNRASGIPNNAAFMATNPGLQNQVLPNPAAGPAATTTAAQPAAGNYNPLDPAWDYNGVKSVPWQAFLKNLFGENNANMQSFAEVKGVLDEARMKEAEKYGWAAAVPGNADANVVYRAAIQLAQQNPNNDYTIVRLNVNGQPQYAALMREQDPAAQFARGYISPAKATELAQQRAAAQAAQARTTAYGSRGALGTGPGFVTPAPVGPGYGDKEKRLMGAGLGAAVQLGNAIHKLPIPAKPGTAPTAGQLGDIVRGLIGQTGSPAPPAPGAGAGAPSASDLAGIINGVIHPGTQPAPSGHTNYESGLAQENETWLDSQGNAWIFKNGQWNKVGNN